MIICKMKLSLLFLIFFLTLRGVSRTNTFVREDNTDS